MMESHTVAEVYRDAVVSEELFDALVNRSLEPRPSTMLYDKMGALGLVAGSLVLDAGCRDAKHTCELVTRFGYRAVGVDLVMRNVVNAQRVIAERGIVGRVTAVQGDIQDLPLPDGAFTAVWCRDVLGHPPKLHQTLAEFARVLQPGGRLLIYVTLATDKLEPLEAQWLFETLVITPQNMSHAYLEAGLWQAGFAIDEIDRVDSEWREYWEEDGTCLSSQQLLRLARLRRNREALIAQVGERDYLTELADCHWGVYQMLGKLCPTVYVATKR